MLVALFSGGAASGSSVLFSHWISLIITLPLTLVSTVLVLKSHGVESRIGTATLIGGLLVCLNPVWNLAEDLHYIEHDENAFFGLNVLTWTGIVLSVGATLAHTGLWQRGVNYIYGIRSSGEDEPVCERR